MSTPDHRVSVVIPAYQAAAYIEAALASVQAQEHRPFEVIVIDDGSTDGTAEIVRGHPSVRYAYQKTGGVAAAKNAGAALATGELLAFLDADDFWAPDKLRIQVLAFRDDATLDMVFGHVQQFVSPELDDAAKARLRCPDGPLPGLSACAMLIRREAFWRVGPFRTEYAKGSFLEWHARAVGLNLRSLMLSEVVFHRRLHATNIGVVAPGRDHYLRIVRAAVARNREASEGPR